MQDCKNLTNLLGHKSKSSNKRLAKKNDVLLTALSLAVIKNADKINFKKFSE